ncbi:hypothetical protein TWF696_000811 [Orbilia brochopaga]|uniref:HNH nuclease domain-containing protein n=1 Tax=Orbilia brochopaga TaxID=3140254 RepID=A0AAV9VCF6_9PEZI
MADSVIPSNGYFCFSDVLRHLVAVAAGIKIDHEDLDARPDRWLEASDIFNVNQLSFAVTWYTYLNECLLPFESGDQKVPVLQLIYAFLTYGLQPNAMALDLLQEIVEHKECCILMRKFFRMKRQPVNDRSLVLQLKLGRSWEEAARGLFSEHVCGMEMRGWAWKYFHTLLVQMAVAKGTPTDYGSSRNQETLREQCLKRDGHMTVVGRVWSRSWPKDVIPPLRRELSDYGSLKLYQIIPYDAPEFPNLLELLVQFSGDPSIADAVDDASNAFMLTPLFHNSFRRFEWSIEAHLNEEGSGYVYRFRKFSLNLPTALAQHADGMEVFFGTMDGSIPMPDPRLLNLHTALAKVANASGALGMIDSMTKDEEVRMQTRARRTPGQNAVVRQLERMSLDD